MPTPTNQTETAGKVLYLIDGHAQFFRAYHAIRTPMTSPVTGEPTNATFGFVGMLLKLLREKRPDYLAVAIDASGDRGTFRSQMYPLYKAHRPPVPENLPEQINRCIAILEALGAPVLAVEEIEADDTIATIARRLTRERRDLVVRIVSKDKDLMQLLERGRIEMYDPYNDELSTADMLKEKIGVRPDQVIDYLSLVGDAADNVPGVSGVGAKTAATLLNEYGSLDELMRRSGEIKGKRGEALRDASDTLLLARKLVTLRDNAGIPFSLADADARSLHPENLEPILRELGFNRHRDELMALLSRDQSERDPGATPRAASSPATVRISAGPDTARSASPEEGSLFEHLAERSPQSVHPVNEAYRCITTRAELDDLLHELRGASILAIDTETTGLDPMRCRLVGVSVAHSPCAACYIPVRSPDPSLHLDESTVLEALRPMLEDPSAPKTGHNLKYDILVFRRHGVSMRGVVFDSMIASFLIDSSRSSHGMDALSQALLGHICIPISDLIGAGKHQRTFDTVLLDDATQYAAEDADISLRLHNALAPKLRAMKLQSLFDDIEMPLVEVLAELEWNGVLIDPDELDRQRDRLNTRIAELRHAIIAAAPRPFNPDSPKQLAAILFNPPDHPSEPGLGLKPLKKTKTGYSTDIEVLEKLADETISRDSGVHESEPTASKIPRLIVEHRQLTKLVGTYLVALKGAIHPETGRIHTSFHQTGAATGRLSSSDPNLQNIPIRTDIGRDIRKAFIAPPGRMLISADYSQIELRMLAHLSRDEALTRAFHEGEDIHRAVAAEIHGARPEDITSEQRAGAKMVNFGIVYGVTPFGLARRLGVSNDQAAAIIDGYKKRFPGITTFLAECVEQARRLGYVETILKRRRAVPQIHDRNPQTRALGERIAINSVVQGSAADLIKIAMIDLHRRLSDSARDWRMAQSLLEAPEIPGVHMLIQIHDELVFEAPEEHAEDARRLIVERMEHAMELRVPLVADSAVSRSWFDGK